MSLQRMERINDEVRRELSKQIQNLKDPRIRGLVSILRVDVTRDLRYAKVHISVMGSPDDPKQVLAGLKSAAGFLRGEVARATALRAAPELQFVLDDSIEEGSRILELMNEIDRKDEGADD